MATYTNPEAFVTNTDWKPNGPLAGALEGMRTNIGLEQLTRQNRDSDLANQDAQFSLGQKQADEAAWGESVRASKKETADFAADEIRSGRAKQKSELDIEGKKTDIEAKNAEIKAKKMKAALDRYEAMGDLATNFVTSSIKGMPAGTNGVTANPFGYATLRNALKESGLPELDDDPQIAWQQLNDAFSSYQSTAEKRKEARKQQEQLELIAARGREAQKTQLAKPVNPKFKGIDQKLVQLAEEQYPDDPQKQMEYLETLKAQIAALKDPAAVADRAGVKLAPGAPALKTPEQVRQQGKSAAPEEPEITDPNEAASKPDGAIVRYKGKRWKKTPEGLKLIK